MEAWREVIGSDRYEVSDQGNVRRVDKPDRWLKIRPDRSGYLRVALNGRSRAVHHLVLEAFVELRPDPKAETRHLNGDRGDNRPDNLAWGDRRANAADKREHGTHNNTQRQTCRRRGHDLVAPNLVDGKWIDGKRRCRACYYAHAVMLRHRRKGTYLDRDIVADHLYAWLMEGGPDPRKVPGMLSRAQVATPQDAVIAGGRLRSQAPTTRWALRQAFSEGDEFSMADAMAAVSAAGLSTSEDGVRLALARGSRDGMFLKLGPARYRRLTEHVVVVDSSVLPPLHPVKEPRPLQPCGTYAAFSRHVKAGEEPCDPCREAGREYQREAWQKRKAADHAA